MDIGKVKEIEYSIYKSFYLSYGLAGNIRLEAECVADCPYEPPAIHMHCPCDQLKEESFERVQALSYIQFQSLYMFLIQHTTSVTTIASETNEFGDSIWGLNVLYDSQEYSSHAVSFNSAILQAYISMPESWRMRYYTDVQRICNG